MATLTAGPVAPPERSITQRHEALRKANRVRTERAQLKKDIHGGAVSITDVLRQPPEFIETMKVCDLLLAVPKYGRVKVNKAFKRCRISPSKTVGGLSERQCGELVASLLHR